MQRLRGGKKKIIKKIKIKNSVLASIQMSESVKQENNVRWTTGCLNPSSLQGAASIEMAVGERREAPPVLRGGRKATDVGKEFG